MEQFLVFNNLVHELTVLDVQARTKIDPLLTVHQAEKGGIGEEAKSDVLHGDTKVQIVPLPAGTYESTLKINQSF